MLHAACAVSASADPQTAARELARGLAALGPGPAAAALFFATQSHGPAYARIEHAVRQAVPSGEVVGCSAAGILSRAGEREHGPGVAALALRGDFEVQRFFVPALRGRADAVGREIGRAVGMVAREPRTVLLLADSYNLAPDELLAAIEGVAPGVVVLGAGASEDGSLGETTVVGRATASSNAVTGLVLGGVHVRSAVAQSAAPVGPWFTVTRAQTNRVLHLDGETALDVYLRVLPALLREDLPEALRRTRVALLANARGDVGRGDERPAYVVRSLLGADPDTGALLVGDEVVPGMRLAIAVRDGGVAREDLSRAIEGFVRSPGLAAALYFDGVERGESLYGIPDLDTAYLGSVLGNVELAGFFSALEIAPLAGRNRFHQASGVLVGFSAG